MTAGLPLAPIGAPPLERPMPAAASTVTTPDGTGPEDVAAVRFAALLAPLGGPPALTSRPVSLVPLPVDRTAIGAARASISEPVGDSNISIEQWLNSYISNISRLEGGPVETPRSGAAGVSIVPAADRDPSDAAAESHRFGGVPINALAIARDPSGAGSAQSESIARRSSALGERAYGGSGPPPGGSPLPLPRTQAPSTIGRDLMIDGSAGSLRMGDNATFDRPWNPAPAGLSDPRSIPSPAPIATGIDARVEAARTAVDPPLPDALPALPTAAAPMARRMIDATRLDDVEPARGELARTPLGARDSFGLGDRVQIDVRADHRAGVDSHGSGPIDRIVNTNPEARAMDALARSFERRDSGTSGTVERTQASRTTLGAHATLASGLGDGAKPTVVPPQAAPAPSMGQSPELGKWLGDRLIALASRGEQRARIALHPAELGAVDVQIKLRDDAASVAISAQHPHARELIEASIPRLREMFAQQGLNLVDVDVSGQRDDGRAHADGLDDHAAASSRPWQDRTEPAPASIATPSRNPARLVDLLA